jgi:hypothetical protein
VSIDIGAVPQINLKEQYAKITETLKFKNSGAASLDELTICQLESLTQHEASYTVRLKPGCAGQPSFACQLKPCDICRSHKTRWP